MTKHRPLAENARWFEWYDSFSSHNLESVKKSANDFKKKNREIYLNKNRNMCG